MRFYFIVNPISGSGRGKRAFLEAKELMDAAGLDYGFVYTEYKRHAVELAKTALEAGEKNIIAVGGDGTTQEIASVLEGTDAVMGLFPFGTGNDFAAAVGLTGEVQNAVDALMCYDVRKVDAAMANDAFFVNVAGFGFDVDVVVNTEKYKKKFIGMLPYMLGVLEAALHLRTMPLKLTHDGECEELTAVLFSACNGIRFGGGMNLAPASSVFDGTMDICVLKKVNLIQFLLLLPRYVKGKHLDSPHIRYFKTADITVDTDYESTLNLDGELASNTPVRFRVKPAALNFIVGGVD